MNCPKCHGTNGFTYNLVLKTSRSGVWGFDDDEEIEAERTSDPRTVTCLDCKKRIEWDIAHGLTRSAEHRDDAESGGGA